MTKQHSEHCPIAAFLNLFGDAWTLLVIREVFYGATSFSEIQRNTGMAKNMLSNRLKKLASANILKVQDVGKSGPRNAYSLTEKGTALIPVIVSMAQWSNEHLYEAGFEHVILRERASGDPLPLLVPHNMQGKELDHSSIIATPGPAAHKATINRLNKSR